jgi:tRNA threonylcarbamoyladenosine biosynthesis protein TsaB
MMSEMKHNPEQAGEQSTAAAAGQTADLGATGHSTGLLLALDSATSAMSVALVNNEKLLTQMNSVVERNHSVYMMPVIQEVLNSQGLGVRNLKGIAVGRGPGSYTGVRIGITVAKTMAWALKLPVVSVSSLEAMAAGALSEWLGGRDSSKVTEEVTTEASDNQASVQEAADAIKQSEEFNRSSFRHIWVVPMLNARRGQVFTTLMALRTGTGHELLNDAVDEAGHQFKDEIAHELKHETVRESEAGHEPKGEDVCETEAVHELEHDAVHAFNYEATKASSAMWPVGERGWKCRREDGIRLMERWVDELLELARSEQEPPDAILFAGETKDFGDAIGRFRSEADWAYSGPVIVEAGSYDIQAEFIGYLGGMRLALGQADEVHNLLPNYTQLSEAEVNLAAKNKQ